MKSTGIELLNEILKFIEFCQNCFANGKIDFPKYLSLTKYKVDFVEFISNCENEKVNIDENLKNKIAGMHFSNFMIFDMQKKCVGK